MMQSQGNFSHTTPGYDSQYLTENKATLVESESLYCMQEYKPPSTKDIPIDFRVDLLKNAPNPIGILGSKGMSTSCVSNGRLPLLFSTYS